MVHTAVKTILLDKGDYLFEVSILSNNQLHIIEQYYEKEYYNFASLKAFDLCFKKGYLNGLELDKDTISYDLKKDIGFFIIEQSEITEATYEKLTQSIEIYFDKVYDNDSWNCDICRKRKLDISRNCGYRNEKNKRDDFKAYVKNKKYTYCPVYDVDKELLAKSIECFNAFDKGFLMNNGGMGDQTKFFNLAVSMVKVAVNEVNDREMEKLQKDKTLTPN